MLAKLFLVCRSEGHLSGSRAAGLFFLFLLYPGCPSWHELPPNLTGPCFALQVLRHKLLEPGGATDAHSLVEGLLGGSSQVHEAQGGWFPDAHSMLEQQGLLV